MNGDNSVFLVACAIAGAIFNGPWGRTPVYAPVPHETAVVSCVPELRKLLELRDQLDRYRLALLAVGALTLVLLALPAAAALITAMSGSLASSFIACTQHPP